MLKCYTVEKRRKDSRCSLINIFIWQKLNIYTGILLWWKTCITAGKGKHHPSSPRACLRVCGIEWTWHCQVYKYLCDCKGQRGTPRPQGLPTPEGQTESPAPGVWWAESRQNWPLESWTFPRRIWNTCWGRSERGGWFPAPGPQYWGRWCTWGPSSSYRAIQKELGRDNGLALFIFSFRQDSTSFHFYFNFIISAVLPGRDCKQSEPGVTTKFFLKLSV